MQRLSSATLETTLRKVLKKAKNQPDIFNQMIQQFNDIFVDIVSFEFPDDLWIDITDGEIIKKNLFGWFGS